MQVFGHEWIESETFYPINSIEQVSQTPPNSLVQLTSLSESLELAKHCQSHGIRYALKIKSVEEAIFANLLGASYILAEKALTKTLMPIAQHYLFDTRILAFIKKHEIEEMAKSGVDGVIIL